jgi:hypothetical protein
MIFFSSVHGWGEKSEKTHFFALKQKQNCLRFACSENERRSLPDALHSLAQLGAIERVNLTGWFENAGSNQL